MRILKVVLIGIAVICLIVVYIERQSVFDYMMGINTLKEELNPSEEYDENMVEYMPEQLMNQKNTGNDDKNLYKLVKELEIGNIDNGKYKFFHLLDIETDVFGDVYLLDGEQSGIMVFNKEGIYSRSFFIKEAPVYSMVSLSINSDNVIAVANKQKHKIYFITDFGELLGGFPLPFEPVQVQVLNDEYIVLGIYKNYLVHRYSKDGKRLSGMCSLEMENETEQDIMKYNKSHLDVDFNNNIFVTYTCPYKILKLYYTGVPQVVFSRDISDEIPDSLSCGKTGAEGTFIISLDVATDSDGNVYNLLKNVSTDGGSRIDKFDSGGHYLQTLYLEEPADCFVLYRNETIWCLTGNNKNKIIKYRIEKVTAG